MQPDQLGNVGLIEMAAQSIANLRVQFIERIGLGKYGLARRLGYVAAHWRVFDNKMISFIDCLSGPENITSDHRSSQASS